MGWKEKKVTMLLTPFDERYKFKFNIRPVKIAYFIPEDDWASLTRVLRLVCTQWGGIRNLVIPIKSDLGLAPVFKHLLRLCEPDWFVGFLSSETRENLEDHSRFQEYLSRLFPYRHMHLQMGDYFEAHDHTAHALSVMSDDDLEKNILAVPTIASADLPEWLNLSIFGVIYPGQERFYSDSIQVREEQVTPQSRAFWEYQFNTDPFSSILNSTGYGIGAYTVTGGLLDSNHFDIVFVDSFNSLCMFWNFRALRDTLRFRQDKAFGRRTILFPAEFEKSKVAFETFVAFLREKLPYPSVSSNLHVRFCACTEETYRRVEPIISALPDFEKFNAPQITVSHRWSSEEPPSIEDLSKRKLTYKFMLPDLPESYREGIGQQPPLTTPLNYRRNEILFEPPSGFRNRLGGSTAIDLECDVWNRFPRSARIAESIKSGSWFSRYGLSMTVGTSERAHYFDFNLPEEWQTLFQFFESKGYGIQVSKAGQYCDALVNLVGGLGKIDLLASRKGYILLDILALKSTKKIAQRISKQVGLEGHTADIQRALDELQVIPELKGVPKTYRQLQSDERLQLYRDGLLPFLGQLCEAEVLKRGFYLICPNCGAPDWYPLQSLRERLICSGCSNEFVLPVEYPQGSEIEWEYRLNTLVNRAVDQDILPNVLALNYLTKGKKCSCITFGVEVLQESKILAEFDFIFVSEQQVFAGECKAGTELWDKDLELASLAAKVGIAKFYFCTVKTFSEDTQRRIEARREQLKGDGFELAIEVLSGNELLGQPI